MSDKRRFCLLVPDKNESMIHKYYLDILGRENCLCIPLWFKDIGRVTAKERREWFNAVVMPKFEDHQCEYLLVCDAECFKILSGKNKAETSIGYVLDDNDKYYLAYVPTYKTSFKDPIRTKEKITLALNGVLSHSSGSYKEVGSGIIEKAIYCSTVDEISNNLKKLHLYAKLTCDIETWSLKHYNSGIVSICFCWNENEGLCFRVDNKDGTRNEEVRSVLKKFFTEYSGTLIFHNITFDCYILTYQLFMNSLHDIDGMLEGINTLLKNFDDTKLIAYLATNSCAGNQLGLKALAQEYAGDWAEEITNIDEIQEEELLKYNLIDGLATWYVYKKYYKRMIQDEQLEIYQNIFKPACKDIIQMQLTGLPIDLDKVLEAEKELNALSTKAMLTIQSSPLVQEFMKAEAEEWVFMKNQKLKKKKVTVADFKESFNPGSSLQLQRLLYQFLNLPVLDKTVTDVPATGKKEIEKLINQTDKEEIKELIRALIDWKDVSKILTAFIPAFKNAVYDKDLDCHFLYGNFNLGGTVSGRLSSSNINLQQLPATGSKYAKLIKSCFKAPKGWLFIGLDYSSLEDRISALTTKDPEKLKVYSDGYDSHCLRSYTYFKEQMPDISLAQDTEKCYKAKVGSTYIYFHANEQIEYLGKTYTGEELYALLTNKRV